MTLYLLPFLAALTGWLLCLISQRIFFAPHTKFPLALAPMLHRQKPHLATAIGKMATEYLDTHPLSNHIDTEKTMTTIKPVLEQHINHFLEVKLVKQFPVIGMLGGSGLIDQIRTSLTHELELLLPEVLQRNADQLVSALAPGALITRELNEIPDRLLHQWVAHRLQPFFRRFELAGAIFGFIIGWCMILAQLLLLR